MELDVTSIDDVIDQMSEEVVAAIRPAAQAGAELLYRQVKRNVAAIGVKTGNLQRSIYQVYSKRASRKDLAVYHVSWNPRKAPHGHLVEYGHLKRYVTVIDKRTGQWITLKKRPLAAPVQVGARPFVRPAQAQFAAALNAAQEELFNRLSNRFL